MGPGKRKFSTEKELIPLWIADTDFVAPRGGQGGADRQSDHGVYGYSFATADYIESVAGWLNGSTAWDVKNEWVCPTYGVVTALYFTILALTEPGGPGDDPHARLAIRFTPLYRTQGREVADCGLIREGGTYRMDFERMEEQMKQGGEASDSLQSHNPTGARVAGGELARVAELCVRYGVYLASMRSTVILALFGNPFTSMLKFKDVHSLLAVYTSPGKTFSMTGAIVSTC